MCTKGSASRGQRRCKVKSQNARAPGSARTPVLALLPHAARLTVLLSSNAPTNLRPRWTGQGRSRQRFAREWPRCFGSLEPSEKAEQPAGLYPKLMAAAEAFSGERRLQSATRYKGRGATQHVNLGAAVSSNTCAHFARSGCLFVGVSGRAPFTQVRSWMIRRHCCGWHQRCGAVVRQGHLGPPVSPNGDQSQPLSTVFDPRLDHNLRSQ